MRRLPWLLAAVAVAIVVVIGLSQASQKPAAKLKAYPIDKALRQLDGAPAPLASLYAQHSQLLDGGLKAFRARIRTLRGHPVVVNRWAAWCIPCRQEFGVLQRVSATLGKRVAFVGIDGPDNRGDARQFLGKFPVAYPSYRDDGAKVAQAYEIAAAFPVTLFLDARGKMAYAHQGQYKRPADLTRDIKRYLHA
jgi:cytochrome c biogenesis protein CcmG, thiol:disulfide interchange protein DsbE